MAASARLLAAALPLVAMAVRDSGGNGKCCAAGGNGNEWAPKWYPPTTSMGLWTKDAQCPQGQSEIPIVAGEPEARCKNLKAELVKGLKELMVDQCVRLKKLPKPEGLQAHAKFAENAAGRAETILLRGGHGTPIRVKYVDESVDEICYDSKGCPNFAGLMDCKFQ
mmetsp:Transcript_5227/g.14783  ORF Transcript_5227/g.14783 Transcript_5227/m.14783 type:complete len:166 (-) Transcript_5227:40-537(-)